MRARYDWFWFCSSLVEKVAQSNFDNQSQSAVKQNQRKREITFDTQLKSALSVLLPYDSGEQLHIRQIKRHGYEHLGKDHREDYFTSQYSYKSTERKDLTKRKKMI